MYNSTIKFLIKYDVVTKDNIDNFSDEEMLEWKSLNSKFYDVRHTYWNNGFDITRYLNTKGKQHLKNLRKEYVTQETECRRLVNDYFANLLECNQITRKELDVILKDP